MGAAPLGALCEATSPPSEGVLRSAMLPWWQETFQGLTLNFLS